jgi:hypothetical protein
MRLSTGTPDATLVKPAYCETVVRSTPINRYRDGPLRDGTRPPVGDGEISPLALTRAI